MKRNVCIVVLMLLISLSFGQDKIKVACVGDSITQGFAVYKAKKDSYPAQLGVMLGDKYEVKNFGVGGATMLKKSDRPYWNMGAFKTSHDFKPDIVIIKLGTNDSKSQNWKNKNQFVSDTVALIKSYQALSSKPKVYVCTAAPVFKTRWGISEAVVKGEVIPLIDEAVIETKVERIDIYKVLSGKSDVFPDGIHPNAAGATIIAQTVKTAITK